jgi:4-amino-4-deoxy-L-arabinose transferase-like glycosyltransferase
MTRRELQILIAVLFGAALVRFGVHVELRDYILYQVPLVDAQEYVEWAATLAHGGAEPADVYYKAPLYPRVLSVAMRFFGATAGTAYLLNVVLGVLNVLLLALWVRRFAGARLALWTAAGAAIYAPFLYFEAQALPTTLGLTWVLLSLLALSSREGHPSLKHLVVAAVCMGLAVLTRPSFLMWIPVASAWVWFGNGRRSARTAALGCSRSSR